ncbi:MAG: hypothetical protein HQL95_10245 [Magnetococcales bacterium]|nr:hypothetical protein [Magnetococcales bacterium]
MKDTRVCLNCRFHDPGSYNECRETVAERIVDKDKANFCEEFKSKGSLPRTETLRMSGRNNSNANSGSGGGGGSGSGGGGNQNSKSRSANNNAAWAAAEALFKRN